MRVHMTSGPSVLQEGAYHAYDGDAWVADAVGRGRREYPAPQSGCAVALRLAGRPRTPEKT